MYHVDTCTCNVIASACTYTGNGCVYVCHFFKTNDNEMFWLLGEEG